MMNKITCQYLSILYIFLVTILFSCAKNKDKEENVIRKSPIVVDMNEDFLDEFETVKFDTIPISAPAFEEQNTLEKRLHKDYLNLYPSGFLPVNAVDPPLFAISKFDINDNLLGIIIQGIGKRTKTSVNLIIYNKKKQQMTSFLEVADHFDDKRYSDFKKTWLYKGNENVIGFMWKNSKINPVDAKDPTKPYEHNDYYLLKILGDKIDIQPIKSIEISKYSKFLDQGFQKKLIFNTTK